MKQIFIALLLAISLNCSAQYYHDIVEKVYAVTDLQKDVDFVRFTLKKGQANIYTYITEKDLDYKFDSLKLTLKPITGQLFGAKMLTVLSTIGDGHLGVGSDYSKLTKADLDIIKKLKTSPLFMFEYTMIKDRIYITKNFTENKTIVPGTEVISIDNKPATQIIAALMKHVPSDGYNTTFKYFLLNNPGSFGRNYCIIYGYCDSTRFELRTNDTARTITLHSFSADTTKQTVPVAAASIEWKAMPGNNSVYWVGLHSFNDAYKITETYNNLFKELKRYNAKTLILDLRGNMGGANILGAAFFSYLIDTTCVFHKPIYAEPRKDTVLSKRTLSEYKSLKYTATTQASVKPKQNAFKGKLYILINGGTFSCGAMLASALKRNNKGIFIGTETGGSSNIWTGARYFKNADLPESKLVLHYGDISYLSDKNIKPFGYGVMPDVPINYTIKDNLTNKDLEMEWVLNDIRTNKH